MTVSYSSEVVNTGKFSVFVKLLCRWKGSVYKLIWKDVILFILIYYAILLLYTFGLKDDLKLGFLKIILYCKKYYNLIPLSFVLGFFVTLVVNRWWDQYKAIPFPDNLALQLSSTIVALDEQALIIRRTIVRYVCLTFTMTMSMMSPKVKKRFPTYDHYIEAGLLMHDEKTILIELGKEYPYQTPYWMPLAWAANIVTKSRMNGYIKTDLSMRGIHDEINNFRSQCGRLLDYDWISIPLVYTQVVTLAVYSYFITTILAQQYVDDETDLYFPFLTILEFFFYMGWLKVAETLINPFGDDDDDFEINWLIDRHRKITFLIVDKMHNNHPELVKDQYWNKKIPDHLPYTVATEQDMEHYPTVSTDNITLSVEETEIIEEDSNSSSANQDSWILKNFHKRRANHRPLHSHDEIYEMNNYQKPSEDCNKLTENLPESDSSEFDELKLSRQVKMKQRLKKYVTLLRKSTIEEEEENKLIEEIVEHSKID